MTTLKVNINLYSVAGGKSENQDVCAYHQPSGDFQNITIGFFSIHADEGGDNAKSQ